MTNEQIAEQLVKECGITAPYDSLKKLVIDALEMKQRDEAYNELQGMFDDCQRKLSESLQREAIATKIINEKRKEIGQKYDEHDRQFALDFMDYLNKRGFFRDDLCFDCEHQALTYIEIRNRNRQENNN